MDFKSQICTTREQSERLLSLGLKHETADMFYNLYFASAPSEINNYGADLYKDKKIIPSWSLARLLEMMPQYIDKKGQIILMIEPPLICYYDTAFNGQYHFTTRIDIFDNCVDMIAWLVENGYFNQDYLIHSNSLESGKEATNE